MDILYGRSVIKTKFLGAGGRRFKSYCSDQLEETKMDMFGVWIIIGVNILVVALLAPMVWDLIKNG